MGGEQDKGYWRRKEKGERLGMKNCEGNGRGDFVDRIFEGSRIE